MVIVLDRFPDLRTDTFDQGLLHLLIVMVQDLQIVTILPFAVLGVEVDIPLTAPDASLHTPFAEMDIEDLPSENGEVAEEYFGQTEGEQQREVFLLAGKHLVAGVDQLVEEKAVSQGQNYAGDQAGKIIADPGLYFVLPDLGLCGRSGRCPDSSPRKP
jgi:hypothetical protein